MHNLKTKNERTNLSQERTQSHFLNIWEHFFSFQNYNLHAVFPGGGSRLRKPLYLINYILSYSYRTYALHF